jgi:hypothetical protein
MGQPQSCFDCGKTAPDTETSYTLISPMHGWRVTREKDASGNAIARWRCADCWKKYKDSRGGEPGSPPPASRRR